MKDRQMSFMGILKKVDKTFERDDLDNHTARHASGYEIDLIRRFPPHPENTSEHLLQLTPEDGDLWPLRASMVQKLLSVPHFDQAVIGINGGMGRMHTVHPQDFASIKRQPSVDLRREPLKKTKNLAQAALIKRWCNNAAAPRQATFVTLNAAFLGAASARYMRATGWKYLKMHVACQQLRLDSN